jgi:hypothetical protein
LLYPISQYNDGEVNNNNKKKRVNHTNAFFFFSIWAKHFEVPDQKIYMCPVLLFVPLFELSHC